MKTELEWTRQDQLKDHFSVFRSNVVGIHQELTTPYGKQKMVYADWTASGRLYRPIEQLIVEEIGPFVANTHTETSFTGSTMTHAYHQAREIIKRHVGAEHSDILICCGSGMTGAINKFQRILGFKVHERFRDQCEMSEEDRPLVIVSHMEHHSNQTSWLETIADVVVVPPNTKGEFCLENLEELLKEHQHKKHKIAAVTSCSNVTGVFTPYHKIAAMMHRHGGKCFVDFACSAPYIDINMHPDEEEEALDAIYFSPHKFLGGPGAPGVVIFNENLYQNRVPDHPGGGTVSWTNPWGEHRYFEEIEMREDGGTPPFLQTIKAAHAILLKEAMDTEKMKFRESYLAEKVWQGLFNVPGLHMLADQLKDRLCIFSFYLEQAHYNLVVKLLSDRYGIQTRGGCSCAGTYGHYLLEVSQEQSKEITSAIDTGINENKPGWIRMSLHPIMKDEEVDLIVEAIRDIAINIKDYSKDYFYDSKKNEYFHKSNLQSERLLAESWF
jgi:selenocysteine lyase/cysteine desulfurase